MLPERKNKEILLYSEMLLISVSFKNEPLLFSGIAYLNGYLSRFWKKLPKINNPEVRDF